MVPVPYDFEERGQLLVDLLFACDIENCGAAGGIEKSRSVSGGAGERENGAAQAEIFEGLRGNLMIAIRGLEKQQAIGLRCIAKRFAIGKRREEINDVAHADFAEHIGVEIFVATGAQIDANRCRRDCVFRFQARERAEEWAGIAFAGVKKAKVEKTQSASPGCFGGRRARGQILKIIFIVTIRHENAFIGGERGISLAIHRDGGRGGEKYARGFANGARFEAAQRAPGSGISRIVIFGHGIAQVHDPRLAREAMEIRTDLHGRRNWKRGKNRVNALAPNCAQAGEYAAGNPSRPAIRKRHGAKVAAADGQMTLCIERERAHHMDVTGNFGELAGIGAFVSARVHREHRGLPAIFRKIAAKFQRAENAAAACDRREVIRDD